MSEAWAVVIGALIGSGIIILHGWGAEAIRNRRNAKLLAIRLVLVLDRYIAHCIAVSQDYGDDEPRDDGRLNPGVPKPEFQVENIEGDWTLLPSEVVLEIFKIPYEAEEVEAGLSEIFQYDSPPGYMDWYNFRQLRYAKIGIMAVGIASILRREYGLPASKDDDKTLLLHSLSRIEKE